jgi:SAM-dependent methyltransferase
MTRPTFHPANTATATTTTDPGTGPAWVPAGTRDWPAYFARMQGKPPRDTLLAALAAFEAERSPDASWPDRPAAIDLGCGAGADTAEMLGRGWSVLAIDGHPEAFQRMVTRPGIGPTPHLSMRLAAFEDLGPLPRCRLLNASFSLPFCHPGHFERVWRACVAAIEPGGRFAGQLFGDRDTWAALADRSHFTRAQTEALLRPFEIESLKEEERDGTDAKDNSKHWHVFHIVAKKHA